MTSSSTTERRALPAGIVVGGFRIERLLRASPTALIYEATQLSLGRRVALRVVDDPHAAARAHEVAGRQALVHHPAIVPVYESGDCPHGPFVALRLVPGGTLAGERPDARRAMRLLEQVAAGLEAAHAAGLAHGALTPSEVLVEGDRALIADFPGGEDDVAADRRAFAAMVAEATGARDLDPALPPTELIAAMRPQLRTPRRKAAVLLSAAAALAAAVAVTMIESGDGGPAVAMLPAPPVAQGAVPAGSSLAPGPAATVDCQGDAPSVNSPGCTLAAPGAVARADGVVRAWAVRGARGTLAMQVLRPAGPDGLHAEVHRSQYVAVPDDRPHAFAADVPVRRGDRLAVELAPGAGVGTRRRDGAAPDRWVGPIELIRAPRAPAEDGPAPAGELLVRFDVAAGARRSPPRQLSGAAAAAAPAGEVLDAEELELRGGGVRMAAVVRLEDAVAIDLLRGRRRLARVPVEGAEPAGRLLDLEQGFVDAAVLRLRWLNPARGPAVIHDYAVEPSLLRVVN